MGFHALLSHLMVSQKQSSTPDLLPYHSFLFTIFIHFNIFWNWVVFIRKISSIRWGIHLSLGPAEVYAGCKA